MLRLRPNPAPLVVALQAAGLLAASVLAGAVALRLHPEPPEIYLMREAPEAGEVNMEQVMAMEAATGVLWIDARVREQFDLGHVPGALLLNPQEFDVLAFEYLTTFQDNTKPIVIYCDAQRCAASKTVMQRVRESGLAMDNEVHVLRGGWNAWKGARGGNGR